MYTQCASLDLASTHYITILLSNEVKGNKTKELTVYTLRVIRLAVPAWLYFFFSSSNLLLHANSSTRASVSSGD